MWERGDLDLIPPTATDVDKFLELLNIDGSPLDVQRRVIDAVRPLPAELERKLAERGLSPGWGGWGPVGSSEVVVENAKGGGRRSRSRLRTVPSP